jgi:16S rRNA (uracil1498-N3)-methyltransferase
VNEELRRSAAHVLVDDPVLPVLADAVRHHLERVLRLRDGEIVTVTDGAGVWRRCRWSAGELEPDGEVEHVPAPAVPIELAVAIPKGERPDWLVQKATELGVDRLVFLHADRSVVRWDAERAAKHLAKLRRVAREAVCQSRRVRVPELLGPVPSTEVLATMAVAEPGGRPLAPGDRRVAIGPEGGWSERELSLATDTVRLGVTVLRVETAALAAVAWAGAHAV